MEKDDRKYSPEKYRYTPDIRGWQEAVWDYFMEHCDIEPKGTFFIKFHCDNRRSFENHVRARWKYNYHRDDPREKYREGQDLKAQHRQERTEAKADWQAKKKARQEDGWRRNLRSYLIKLINKYI